MQFQVPQFIEIEDKIIGPLTLKQFFYLAGAALLSFFLFFLFEFFLWIILTAVFGIIAASFAFIRYNGRPFIITLLSAAEYLWQPKFYVWKREATKEQLPSLPEIKKVRSQQAQQKPLENLWNKLSTTTQPIKARERTGLNMFKKMREPAQIYEVQKKSTGERRIYKRVDYR